MSAPEDEATKTVRITNISLTLTSPVLKIHEYAEYDRKYDELSPLYIGIWCFFPTVAHSSFTENRIICLFILKCESLQSRHFNLTNQHPFP